jgi:protein-tyrosine phosphatase
MGAVHGVYLKYVGLSAISFVGYQLVVGNIGPMDPLPVSITTDHRMLLATSSDSSESSIIMPLLRLGTASILGYSTILNGAIAMLFKMRRGMSLIGKDHQNGTIPLWSYALFFPFHIPTYAYTYIHTKCGTMKPYANDPEAKPTKKATTTKKVTVPVASEVQPGWWVGGCYANQLNKQWAGVVDLTVEFPERCRSNTLRYLCLPTWDGVPCSPEQLEKAANFCIEAREEWNQAKKRGLVEGEYPQILIHCAHGRGRSTTVMCAALVKMGLFATYGEALEKGIRPGRPCCKLNSAMRKNLAEWQSIYIDGKKGC